VQGAQALQPSRTNGPGGLIPLFERKLRAGRAPASSGRPRARTSDLSSPPPASLLFPDHPGSATQGCALSPGRWSVARARGPHLVPSRTQSLSPSAPMVLGRRRPGRVGRRRPLTHHAPRSSPRRPRGASLFPLPLTRDGARQTTPTRDAAGSPGYTSGHPPRPLARGRRRIPASALVRIRSSSTPLGTPFSAGGDS
jgi:hypothetical protein